MFLPFETSCSMWFSAVVRYEWVPVTPPAPEASASDGNAPQAANVEWPVTHLKAVFAGVDWVAYPVWRAQANPAWDLCLRNDQQEGDQRSQERARHARRELPAIGAAPSWDAPQSQAEAPAAKLDGKEVQP